MPHMLNKTIQTFNIFFSSGAIVFLVVGIIIDNWVELIPKVKKDKISHSPWMGCCPKFWPEDGLRMISSMMKMSLYLSLYLNFLIGLQFTSMISQNKFIHLFIGFLSLLTGCLLFFAITTYYHKLKQGQIVYFTSYKIRWITLTIYLTIVLFLFCGIFCLVLCTNRCSCLKTCETEEDYEDIDLRGSSIQVISRPERRAMPRSIVHVHTTNSKEDIHNKSQVQARRVTWAL